ncbi:cyaB, partial [Symbiodinium sp. KB8]
RNRSDRSHAGSSASEGDSSGSEDAEENDVEEGETGRLSRMLMHVAPREVVHMRESFVYMVAGLKSFARYMDPEIMRIVVQSKRQAQLGMGKAPVTIFFSDIANFTTIAESLDPETFMSMLSLGNTGNALLNSFAVSITMIAERSSKVAPDRSGPNASG